MSLPAPVFKTMARSQDQLRQAWEQAKEYTATIKEEHVTPSGEKVSGLLHLTQSLDSSLRFWAAQDLPPLPEVFTPNSESQTSPRSKLNDPVDH